MSFILDALKKSEAERQRQAGPALLEMRIMRPPRRLPLWAVAVGVLLIVCVIVLGWLAWRPAAGTTGAAPAANAAPPASAAYVTAPAAPPEVLAAPRTNSPAGTIAATGTNEAPGEPAPPSLQRPAATAASGGIEPESGEGDAARNAADLEPAVTPAAGTTRIDNGSGNLHSYAELSGQLPELRLDLHVYAANPPDRYAFINMHKVREGDVTAEGLQVKEITRDGVVLDYRGTEFLLGRQ